MQNRYCATEWGCTQAQPRDPRAACTWKEAATERSPCVDQGCVNSNPNLYNDRFGPSKVGDQGEVSCGRGRSKLKEAIVWSPSHGLRSLLCLVVLCVTLNAWVGHCMSGTKMARALFYAAVNFTIGNGENTLFWADRWVQGKTIAEIAPNLFKMVPPRVVKKHTVS
ncbi:hypothetical protein U9M48_038955 [Paspalum notatum var. saurae]|uniref:Uncharacterized protein n=1 Tax=Paspalum notatum var. saurae TaxID=547442 RepID=A0AAQ3UIM7_PASNO